MIKKTACIDQKLCVACGCCEKVCPLGAAAVLKGMYAQIDRDKCVGCGKCASACPADIITITQREFDK